MKLLDYFNICFIIFVLLCIFFVMNNEYKLNYYGGDVLKLDPNMIWGIDEGFDSIIGNPPYQMSDG